MLSKCVEEAVDSFVVRAVETHQYAGERGYIYLSPSG
jgi:hypothetical protein